MLAGRNTTEDEVLVVQAQAYAYIVNDHIASRWTSMDAQH